MTITETFKVRAHSRDEAIEVVRQIAAHREMNLTHVHWCRRAGQTREFSENTYTPTYEVDAELTVRKES